MNARAPSAGLASVRARLAPLQAAWAQRAPRERLLVKAAAWVLGAFLVWAVALQPAWRTVREAPRRLDELDRQLQAMQVLAAETRELRALPSVPRAQASAALKAASERLGPAGRLVEQGDRAVLTLTAVGGDALGAWLSEVRAGARARPVELNLTRSDDGVSGTVVLALPTGDGP
ncbi:MAG: putative ral secretion pathway protein GspM [Pseudomonadota bacterium]|jgi:general secretion pathway protein M